MSLLLSLYVPAVDLAWLIPALPLGAAALLGVLRLAGQVQGDRAERYGSGLCEAVLLASLGLLLLLDLEAWLNGVPGSRSYGVWFASGRGQDSLWQIQRSLLLDALSLPVATLVGLIGWLTVRFARPYLHRESGFQRFFLVLMLFIGGLQLLVLSGNAALAFLGWELCGLASFLLIGYQWERPQATRHALFAFVTNRAGDAGFLLGLGFAAAWLGTFEWSVLAGHEALPLLTARLLAAGFVLAALCKSAQLPFSPWLGKALEGPTPSSAIFYGALLVHAGVFLLLRLWPLLAQVPDVCAALIVVGSLTAVYAWLCAQVQTDVKSGLMFGTLFQVALMFIALGFGWTTWVLVHLCLHALWRTWQFLLAPSWLEIAHAPPDPPPAWLRSRLALYVAATQRFWLDRLAETLIAAPTRAFAQDVRALEEHCVDRLLGEPEKGAPLPEGPPLIRADGLAGWGLAHLAQRLQRLERHLALRGRDGRLGHWLTRGGRALCLIEHLLEQPRYLMMAVMATFVVVL